MQEYIHNSSTNNNAVAKKLILEAKESLISKKEQIGT
jgi:hypothetical protein